MDGGARRSGNENRFKSERVGERGSWNEEDAGGV